MSAGEIVGVIGGVVAILAALGALYGRLVRLETRFEVVYKAWEQEALDAIKLLAHPNPHPKRMHELLNKFTDSVTGGEAMPVDELNELAEMLNEAIGDKSLTEGKRNWASKALRFIEAKTGVELSKSAHGGH